MPPPTTARDSFDALVNADLTVCSNSGFCHLAAALSRNVVLVDSHASGHFFGRARELASLDNVAATLHDEQGKIRSEATAWALDALLVETSRDLGTSPGTL